MTAGQRWSKEKPTVPGWYWWRCWNQHGVAIVHEPDPIRPWHTSDRSQAVTLFNSKGRLTSTRMNRMADGEWCGPLVPPADITPNEEA